MRLHRLKIEGFRRLRNVEILLGDATFLIGHNNTGKSTILKAIEILLSAKKQLDSSDYHSIIDEDTGETKPDTKTIVIEGEFRNLPTSTYANATSVNTSYASTPTNQSQSLRQKKQPL